MSGFSAAHNSSFTGSSLYATASSQSGIGAVAHALVAQTLPEETPGELAGSALTPTVEGDSSSEASTLVEPRRRIAGAGVRSFMDQPASPSHWSGCSASKLLELESRAAMHRQQAVEIEKEMRKVREEGSASSGSSRKLHAAVQLSTQEAQPTPLQGSPFDMRCLVPDSLDLMSLQFDPRHEQAAAATTALVPSAPRVVVGQIVEKFESLLRKVTRSSSPTLRVRDVEKPKVEFVDLLSMEVPRPLGLPVELDSSTPFVRPAVSFRPPAVVPSTLPDTAWANVFATAQQPNICLLYTSDAADE